jgi:isopenicillin N synthase-like dioxygenase
MTTGAVPIIDLTPFRTGTAAERQAVARQVGAACEQIGFFTIVGHGIPEELIAEMAQISRTFFDLPMEQKLEVRVNRTGVGYVPLQVEALAASLGKRTPGDLKESLNTGTDFAHDRWPREPATLRDVYVRYFAAVNDLAGTIMRIFALALELPEAYFADKIDRPLAFLRVINYPEQTEAPEPGQLRAGEHTDYGTITILRPENVPGGLQVLDRSGAWLDVRTVPGSYVINIGDAMQYWTNDRWISTLHRVVNPPRDLAGSTRRQSIVFFHTPNDDALIECLPTCHDAANPPRYAPVAAGEHLRRKSEQAGTLADKPKM